MLHAESLSARSLAVYNKSLLPAGQRDRIDILLVSPRNPLNIGAAARAMANFGFDHLSIVAPFATNWMEAKSAVGAPDLLRHARVFDTLAEAVKDCTLVLGTGSLDRRRPVQALLGLPEAAKLVRQTLVASDPDAADPDAADPDRNRIALLFGSEKHGLTSDDLTWCHGVVTIETSEAQPSMNLGQSVAVVLYEISRLPENPTQSPSAKTPLETPLTAGDLSFFQPGSAQPTSAQLDRLAELVEETMEAVNYQTRGLRSANGEALRILLRRLMPREADLRRMMGLFRRILWQLRQSQPRS
jgi:TrmH family RNA methyltransferase